MSSKLSVCVIGAGPAGLAAARALRALRIPYTHFERHHEVGGIWDIDVPGGPMYDSAHFISSKTVSAFSAFPMPQHYPDYPSHRQIFAYLNKFADHYDLRAGIEFGVEVQSVTKNADGTWRVTRSDGTSTDHWAVIVCTGAQWHANVPQIPGNFTGEVIHSRDYRSAQSLVGKRVLVLGAGNSGCDIACDAARSATAAHLSVRRGYWFIPKHIFGMPVDVFASNGPKLPLRVKQALFERMLTLLHGSPERLGLPAPDHRLFESHPIINSQLWHHLQHGDITPHRGIKTTRGHTVEFTDGTAAEIDLIIAATGYRHLVPVAQQYFGDEQHPNLYLTSFSREHENLFGIGFTETNSGAYELFDKLALLVGNYLNAQLRGAPAAAKFSALIKHDDADLSGGIKFISSGRHQGYVDSETLNDYLNKLGKRLRWPLSMEGYPGVL